MSEEREYGVEKASPSYLSGVGVCSVMLEAQHNLREVGSDTGPDCDTFSRLYQCAERRDTTGSFGEEEHQKRRNDIATF